MSAGPRPALRGDIEGLRAVAVLLVLLYHVGFSPLSGGFAGVDAFFVISGFLITSLLIREVEATGTISLMNFYARRARRLLPAATVVLLFTAIAGYVAMPRVELTNLAADIAAAALYVVNWTLAWRSVDYLAEDAAVSPLQHYWSLSVEEQFYLLWPLLILISLALVARRVRPRLVIGLAVLLVSAASLAWSVFYTADNPQMAFFVTTTRVWELGAGALIAAALPLVARLSRPVSEGLALAGLALLAVAALGTDSSTPWPGAAALLPVLGTAAVVTAGCAYPDTAVGRVLSVRPMTWIGGLSYSIYLWHWPLIVLAQNQWPDLPRAGVVALGAASIPLAWLTRRYIEDPIRFGRRITRRPTRALALGAAGMALSVGAAGTVYAAVPQQSYTPPPGSGALALVADPDTEGVPDLIEDRTEAITTTGPITPDPVLATEDVPGYYTDGCHARQPDTEPFLDCVYGDPESETSVAVIGDSKMGQWMPALERIAEHEQWRLEIYVKSACGFVPRGGDYEECDVWNRNVREHLLTEDSPVDVVIASQSISTVEPEFAPTEPDEAIVQGMVDYLAPLQDRGAEFVAIEDNPSPSISTMPGSPESVYECVSEHPDDYSVCHFEPNQGTGTAALRESAERVDGHSINLGQWVCPPGGPCPPVIGEVLLYRQGTHLTASYVESMTAILHRELRAAGVAGAAPMPLVAP